MELHLNDELGNHGVGSTDHGAKIQKYFGKSCHSLLILRYFYLSLSEHLLTFFFAHGFYIAVGKSVTGDDQYKKKIHSNHNITFLVRQSCYRLQR